LSQTELATLREYIYENFSKSEEEHEHHVRLVLEKLRE
jgi:hypothetical protein